MASRTTSDSVDCRSAHGSARVAAPRTAGAPHARALGASPAPEEPHGDGPRAAARLSTAAVEGLNNKAKLTFRKAYGFRGYKCLETALYQTLGKLPEPDFTHRFC
jgi:hypothetical protein